MITYRKVFVTLRTGVVQVLFMSDGDLAKLKGIQGKNITFKINKISGGELSILGTDIVAIGVDA